MVKQQSTTPEQTEAPAVTDAEKEARTKSYAFASTTLRENYLEEFNDLRRKFMSDAGYHDWEPESVVAKRKAETKREVDKAKAKARLDKLYEEFPELRPAAPAVDEGSEVPPEG